ncbi:MAG: hypothetical protein AB9866_12825 [Syntrophobacteraceae bacterium]
MDRKKILLIPTAAFFVALWLPAFQMHVRFYKEFEDAEKRELAAPPQWRTGNFLKIARQCEAYVDDHFGFRTDLIRWNTLMRVHLFGVAPASSVIVGKDSWLFYCSEALEDGNSINDYMGTIPLSLAELEELRLRLEENERKFSQKGIRYIVAIAPNKNTIYAEYLPETIRKRNARTRLDQFLDHMKSSSKLQILDLGKSLREEKKLLPVYWATDSHWNSFGAYVGYREIMNRTSESFPRANAIPIAGKVAVEWRANGGDLAQILFIQDVWPEKYNTVVDLKRDFRPSQHQKLLFRHDSFGDGLYPYLTKHFKRIINVAPFAPFRFEEIYRERPELVLHLFTERYLTQAIHDDFFHKDAAGGNTAGPAQHATR